jgi:integrase/recombinase XerC
MSESTTSELKTAIEDFLGERSRRNDSPHTLRNYGADLREFLEYFSPPGVEPPALAGIDLLSLREWLGHLYSRDQKPATIRRKLASLRALFRFLSREHRIERDPARLLRLPKMPKTLPDVPNTEVTNALVDGTSNGDLEQPFPARDRLLLELLYGCGLRISEAVGLNLEDLDRSERWVRVRGKGRKERQVPYGSKAAEALDAYLDSYQIARQSETEPHALFLNCRGGRLTDRGARNIVKFYATYVAGDSSIHPHTLRHAFATDLLSNGADLRAIQELLGHARLSTTQKYTQVSLIDLMRVYDSAHPKAKL